MAVQRRNNELVTLLTPDFVTRFDVTNGLVGGTKLLEKAANYTITTSDFTIGDVLVVVVSATATITMPAIANCQNGTNTTIIHVKRLVSSGPVTVDGNGAETIEGVATRAIPAGESYAMVATSSEWVLI